MPEKLSARVEKLEDLMVLLAKEHIKTEESFRETDRRFAETDRRFAETDRRMREMDERSRERDRILDERVDKLVSAIGDLIRTRTDGPAASAPPTTPPESRP
ncbi:MAG: hypothetical protein ACLQU1_05970 [Bryobacteraceae bacterium]